METKKCSVCRETKPLTDFYSDKSRKGGLGHRCKICDTKISTEYQIKNADLIHRRYNILKNSAKSRGIELGITIEQHEQILGDRICFYCDEDFSKARGSGLNRCDSSKGYVLGNLKPCCGTCNTLMSNFTVEQLRSRLIKIHRRLTNNKKEGEK